ncbi:Hypothetical predicted protein [Xyrichtys novacula]|uniref:Uncharacterized protein n=1 Tax=Xyrichtys novacula TaxID=13765 RepID=A0AAV1HP86_XYRNO|nr:Hypothetical predicted protein [Xyrichtys novacula]
MEAEQRSLFLRSLKVAHQRPGAPRLVIRRITWATEEGEDQRRREEERRVSDGQKVSEKSESCPERESEHVQKNQDQCPLSTCSSTR